MQMDDIGQMIEDVDVNGDPQLAAEQFVRAAEHVLETWLEAHEKVPTSEEHEGFRMLALHRQGAKGDPSFNACRETCRELAYRYNVITGGFSEQPADKVLTMMRHLSRHLYFFISGKM